MSNNAPSRNTGSGLPLAPTSKQTKGRLEPRPQSERTRNEYVDTPFQHRVQARRPTNLPAPVHAPSRLSFPRPTTGSLSNDSTLPPQKFPNVISTQPTTFTKEVLEEDSIICSRCGRCKCEACATPRKPGGWWLCGGKCLCSPTTAVDYMSCLCCVRGLMYHCARDSDDGAPAVDRPCSCTGPNTLVRWGWMALASIPLPCLLCYWPLEGTRRLCEGTYRRFNTHGCRCAPSPHQPISVLQGAQPQKGLLQDCL